MAKRDYYDVLGVQKSASDDEIKKSYRKLAVKFHPDKNPGDKTAEDKFREATEAYEVLKDTQKKQQYDMNGTRPSFNFNDIFKGFGFGGAQFFRHNPFEGFTTTANTNTSAPHPQRGSRGQDIRITLDVTFEEILNGGRKTIKYKRYDKCKTCSGRGTAGNDRSNCATCKGSGRISMTHNFGNVAINQESVCPQCNGSGKLVKYDCVDCSGKGIVLSDSIVKVTLNKGLSENNNITMKYYGHCGEHQGISGNLIVTFRIKRHDKFTRRYDDVLYNATLTYSQAVLGCTLDIDTLYGTKRIPVAPNTKGGQTIIMKGHGLPNFNHPSKLGSQIIKFVIDIPQDLTSEQQDIIKKLREVGL